MRTTRAISSVNWKYALGELALIFTGITLALAASSWYEDRKEREEEFQILAQFREALENDREEFTRAYDTERDVHERVTALLEHMSGDEPYGASVDSFIGGVLIWRPIRANVAAYEAVKSRGFDLISNENLRIELIYYYEELAPTLRDIYLNDQKMVVDQALPYFYQNLRMVDIWKFVPSDYSQLRNDPYFRNLVMLKLSRLESYLLPNYQRALQAIEELRSKIDAELNFRE